MVEIASFIAQDNFGAAERFLRSVHQKIELLAENPKLGRRRDELAAGIRSFPLGQYLVFYRADEVSITIVRVLSGYRDLGPLVGDQNDAG